MLSDDVVKSSLLDIERRKKAIALALGLRSVRRSVVNNKGRHFRMPNKFGGKTEAQRNSLYWDKLKQKGMFHGM